MPKLREIIAKLIYQLFEWLPSLPDFLQCKQTAKWRLCEEDATMDTYSCTKHLSDMVAVETTLIVPYDGDERCCFVLTLGR